MKTLFIILTILSILIVAAVIAVDPVAETIINRQLSKAKAIQGEVGHVDVDLWKAAIHIADTEIYRSDDREGSPMFSADTIFVDLRWKPLLQKTLVGDVYLKNAEYNHEMSEASNQSENPQSYYHSVPIRLLASMSDSSKSNNSSKIPPFTVDSLRIEQGKVHFRDVSTDPPLTASLTDLTIDGKNISNQPQSAQQFPASLQVEGTTTGNGEFTLDTKMDLLPDRPALVSDLAIKSIDLPALNDFFEVYTGISMNEGQLDIASELEVNNGVIEGYVRPDLKNIEVVEFGSGSNSGSGLFDKSWELIAGLGLQILKTGGDQSLGHIPIRQTYTEKAENQQKSVFESIGEAVSEAFEKEIDKQQSQSPTRTSPSGSQ
ncbi:DUF748 domain-containing protein [Tunicatimonas pelagia]|uniref:DUF748 domain-containing protein n=1 Tax=Tunicatimonas pelagia TaxID=931531 RepID=UPI002666C3D0|nr:DUF748 domain-containing protein [Tunicatimonas pelagia]WKN41390.1 DUF748 domain-containing protein [Tunicatimonas pelagia]